MFKGAHSLRAFGSAGFVVEDEKSAVLKVNFIQHGLCRHGKDQDR